MKNTNRIVWADLVRFIAIFMVICIHCSDPFNVSPEARSDPEYNLWGSIYGAFLRPCSAVVRYAYRNVIAARRTGNRAVLQKKDASCGNTVYRLVFVV